MSTWVKVAGWEDDSGRTLTLYENKEEQSIRLTIDSTLIRHDVDMPAVIGSEIGEKMARTADHLLLLHPRPR